MKYFIHFKTPDAVFYATEDMNDDDKSEAQRVAALFVKYGECIKVEIDTDAETATVLQP